MSQRRSGCGFFVMRCRRQCRGWPAALRTNPNGAELSSPPQVFHVTDESYRVGPDLWGIRGLGTGDRGRALFGWPEHGHHRTIIMPELCQTPAATVPERNFL